MKQGPLPFKCRCFGRLSRPKIEHLCVGHTLMSRSRTHVWRVDRVSYDDETVLELISGPLKEQGCYISVSTADLVLARGKPTELVPRSKIGRRFRVFWRNDEKVYEEIT
jgi:hypothetical protein